MKRQNGLHCFSKQVQNFYSLYNRGFLKYSKGINNILKRIDQYNSVRYLFLFTFSFFLSFVYKKISVGRKCPRYNFVLGPKCPQYQYAQGPKCPRYAKNWDWTVWDATVLEPKKKSNNTKHSLQTEEFSVLYMIQ